MNKGRKPMTVLRRLAFAASIVLCALLAVTAAGSAAGIATAAGGKGGGPLPPGEYRFQTTGANAHLQGSNGTVVDIFASRNLSVFAPDAGPRSVTDETDVFVQVTTGSSFAGGCFVIPPANFSVSKDLQTAVLHTKLTSATPSCGGPPGSALPLPLSLEVTWKGRGIVSAGADENTTKCQNFKSDSQTKSLDGNAVAAATVAGLHGSGSSDSFTGVQGSAHSSDQTQEIKGVPTPACTITF
jgi:hypothetical protein